MRSRIVIPRELTVGASTWPPAEWDIDNFTGTLTVSDSTGELFIRNEFALTIEGDDEHVLSLTTKVMTWLLSHGRRSKP